MADTISIPTQQADNTPPASVRKVWVGAALGTLVAGFFFPFSLAAFGVAAGSFVGAYAGRASGAKIDNQEQITGKHAVKSPSFFNWRLAQYYVAGTIAVVATTLLFGGVLGSLAALAAMGATVYGGIKGKHEMQSAYDHARDVQRQNDISMSIERARALQPQQAVAPAVPCADIKNFVKQEEQRRAATLSATQNVIC